MVLVAVIMIAEPVQLLAREIAEVLLGAVDNVVHRYPLWRDGYRCPGACQRVEFVSFPIPLAAHLFAMLMKHLEQVCVLRCRCVIILTTRL